VMVPDKAALASARPVTQPPPHSGWEVLAGWVTGTADRNLSAWLCYVSPASKVTGEV
jgi:hypothetical protein